MILSYEVEDENLTPFEKFFLFEAPLEKPKRKNVKVIKVRGGSRGKDYTQMDEDESSDNSSEDTNNDTSDDNSDNTEDSEDNGGNTSDDDNESSSDEDNTDDSDNDEESEDNEDYTSDNNSDSSDDSGDSDDGSDGEEDNEDYTSDGGDDDTGDDSDNDSSDDSDNDSSDSSEDEKNNKIEKLRKFNLFKDFIKLRGTLETYIEKLDSIVSDNNEINSLYKNVTNRFRTLNELIYDYMVIKFERNTYFKSFLFYQRVIATMQFNIDLLEKVKKKEQSLIKSKNNKLK